MRASRSLPAIAFGIASSFTASMAADENAPPPRQPAGRAVRTFMADGRYLLTFPARASAKGVWLTAGVVGATALTLNRDQAIRDNVVDSNRPGADRIATKFEPLGRLEVEAAALGALYLAGRSAGNGRTVSTAATAFESYLWATLVTTASKAAFGREPPGEGSQDGRFFSGDSIFPSGHTLRSFAIASVLADRYGRRAALFAYPVASLVGLSMIQEDRHWASDIVAGAGLGLAIGHGLAARHPGADPRPDGGAARGGRASWTLLPHPGGAAIRFDF